MERKPATLVADIADEGVPDQYTVRCPVVQSDLQDALTEAIDHIDSNLETFYDRFPTASSDDLVYPATDNLSGWTTSFWTGQCWLATEVTDNRRFEEGARAQVETFDRRLEMGDVKTHDLGFLYTLSAVAGYRLTGEERYRKIALTASDYLLERFWDVPQLLQAWGDPDAPNKREWAHGRMIADTMMNLPLLYWASEVTGKRRYAAVADAHARTNAEHIVRADGSTYHTFQCDVETGEPIEGETHQGYADDSCWARGQAWAIYGYAIAADYTDEPAYAELAAKLANYYLNHVEDDHVPRWDFDAPEDDHVRDTSAAAIAACGLASLSRVLPLADERVPQYRNAALATLNSLARGYTSPTRSNGLLTDAAYNRNNGDFDECCTWGDYFYVEGLVRATERWDRYW